jgi:hypothetical protein
MSQNSPQSLENGGCDRDRTCDPLIKSSLASIAISMECSADSGKLLPQETQSNQSGPGETVNWRSPRLIESIKERNEDE